MPDDETVEMIITVDGDVKSIVFAEEVVAAAPTLKGWQFTALKPAIGFDVSIGMDDYTFDKDNIFFINNEDEQYPDEIDLTLVHKDYSEDKERSIGNGCLIYLDNALGELNTAMLIDNISIGPSPEEKDKLIPISKLSEFFTMEGKRIRRKIQGHSS